MSLGNSPLVTRVNRALLFTVKFLDDGTVPASALESLTDLMALSIATDLLKKMFCEIDMQDTSSAEYLNTANMIQMFNKVQDSDGIWLLTAVLLERYVDETSAKQEEVIRQCKHTVDKEFKEWASNKFE